MSQPVSRKLSDWVNFLTRAEIPVLKQTARNLEVLTKDEQNLNARSYASVVKNDPLMTVKLMRYMQDHKHRCQEHDVMEAEQIVMMLGLETLFKKIPPAPLVEEVLGRNNMSALIHLLKTAHRSNMAASYAYDWAIRLHDLHFADIRLAALLHDIAEILMWCFAPVEMLKVKQLQKQNKALRSAAVQEKILGFTLNQLQHELAVRWKLPELLITLMDDEHAKLRRVRNVILAVNLARHSANGWDDAALPDDYEEISKLLHLPVCDVMTIVGANKQHESAHLA
ncbi:HDOD domain-containing protein [Nitrosomonas ureae]|uniref:HD-like signal output (HDOD) domain, no enzymatic activity n=1 Tax=Nitrosomonas ureae TaxID=44577 RepID=A0A0S3AGI1_9PROT|nr:HDOD domain-containing protein [Nitrosomonas ureae]ALQ50292.1 metal-dependent hydrolase [Nitrosomonas ureae]SDT95388.1 HD-like signal output (HDOD) domain, no enzymatic activity [Nitrosomonas ureae]SEP66994.1 HD-like signal output (HDOD) domain, no enzymatic activity [Nitrosomonas ureae]